MAIEINHINKNSINFMEIFNLNIDSNLNIYNQAVLKRKSSISILNKTNTSFAKKDKAVLFEIHGEVEGFLIGLINGKDLNEYKSTHFQSLFIESFNILAGNFLTNLDKNIDLMCTLSSPREIQNLNPIIETKYNHKFITHFELITLNNTYDCEFIFVGNEKKIAEV